MKIGKRPTSLLIILSVACLGMPPAVYDRLVDPGVVRGHCRWGTGSFIYIIQTSPPASCRHMAFPRGFQVLLSASPLTPPLFFPSLLTFLLHF